MEKREGGGGRSGVEWVVEWLSGPAGTYRPWGSSAELGTSELAQG